MDILHLVDRLEELVNKGHEVPFTRSVILDEDRILDLIDQMRVAIPDEVKKAQQILVQKDRILAQAQEEASRTVQLAREKSEQLVERDSIVQAAKALAEQREAEILQDSARTRREADEYVISTLTNLEIELERMLSQARNGIKALQQNLAILDSAPDTMNNIPDDIDEIEHR